MRLPKKMSRAKKTAFVLLLLAVVQWSAFSSPTGEEAVSEARIPEISFLALDYGRDKINDDLFVFSVMERMIGVKVHPVPILQSEFQAKLNTVIASRDIPDVLSMPFDLAQEYGPAGLLVNYRPALASKLPNLNSLLESFSEVKGVLGAEDGGYYSLPHINERIDWEYVISLRQDLLDELGIEKESIQTLGDLYQYLKKTKGMLDGLIQYPWTPPASGKSLLNSGQFLGYGTLENVFFDDDGIVKYGPLKPGYRDVVQFLSDCYREGLLHPDIMSLSTKENKEMFWQGKSSFFFYSENTVLAEYNFELVKYSGNEEFEFTTIWPVSVAGQRHIPRRMNAMDPFYNKAIYSGTKELDAVYKFIDYIYGDEGKLTFYWGEENVHWREAQDGKIEWLVNFGWNENELPAGTPTNVEFGLGNKRYVLSRPYMPSVESMDDVYYALVERNQARLLDPEPLISSAMTPAERDEYRTIMAAVATYASENVSKFVLGQRPMSQWNDFVAGLDTAKIARAIGIYNTVYQRMSSR